MNQRAIVEQGLLLADRYELVQRIASGGMAQVWVATDLQTNGSVAVKILHEHLAADEDFRSRFRLEAIRAQQLEHPSIVSILNTVDEPVNAIIMEHIDGRNLRDTLDEIKALRPKKVMQIGIEIAEALELAHEAGIVHRDIKPANIMLQDGDLAVITDFGIAKADGDLDLTDTGNLLGTAKYVSPEQVNGQPLDARSDLYSLAVVLYEALTGRPPFQKETEAATALARLQEPAAPPSAVGTAIPSNYDDFFATALSLEPDERFSSAAEFAEAARKTSGRQFGGKALPSRFKTASPESWSDRLALPDSNRGLIGVGAALLLGAGALAIWLLAGSVGNIETESLDDSIFSDYTVLTEGEPSERLRAAAATFDEDPNSSWVLTSDTPMKTLLLELREVADVERIAVNAEGGNWTINAKFYGAESPIDQPIAEVDLNDISEVQVTDATQIQYIMLELADLDDPTLVRPFRLREVTINPS